MIGSGKEMLCSKTSLTTMIGLPPDACRFFPQRALGENKSIVWLSSRLPSTYIKAPAEVSIPILPTQPSHAAPPSSKMSSSTNSLEFYISSLPTIVPPQSQTSPHKLCPICYNPFGAGRLAEDAVLLPCHHVLGDKCLHQYLDDDDECTDECPICGKQLFVKRWRKGVQRRGAKVREILSGAVRLARGRGRSGRWRKLGQSVGGEA